MVNFNTNYITNSIISFFNKNILTLLLIICILIIIFIQKFQMVKLGIDFINDNIAHIIFTAFIFVYIMIILAIFSKYCLINLNKNRLIKLIFRYHDVLAQG